jgi:hypothetical protein
MLVWLEAQAGCLDVMEKRKASCSCWELNPNYRSNSYKFVGNYVMRNTIAYTLLLLVFFTDMVMKMVMIVDQVSGI